MLGHGNKEGPKSNEGEQGEKDGEKAANAHAQGFALKEGDGKEGDAEEGWCRERAQEKDLQRKPFRKQL